MSEISDSVKPAKRPYHRKVAVDPTAVPEKPVKVKAAKVNPERTHFDVFSRERGYLCSCPNEDKVHESLKAMFDENERFWRRARADGKKFKRFDCYGVARTGIHERVIELTFDADDGDGDGDASDSYEDIAEAGA
jgi:hypothetical protein